MKKMIKDDDDALIIEVSSRLIKVIGCGALFFLGFPAVQAFLHNPLPKNRLIGFIGAAVTCGVAYLAAYEEGLFTFDSRTRLLTWRRKRSLSRRQGAVPFDQIKQVILESAIGNSRYYPKARVILLIEKDPLPLSVSYEYDAMNQVIAERIRKRLGFSPEALVEESVASSIEQGRDLDAIRLLREKHGISLTDAKLRIDQIKSRKKE